MKLHYGFVLAMVIGSATGCTGAQALDVGNLTGELASDAPLKKLRDSRPARTPAERFARYARGVDATLPAAPLATASAPQPALVYHPQKGPLLQSVEVYAVFWGPNIGADIKTNIGGFFTGTTAANSPLQQMLAEYNTNGMTVGAGSFKGAIADDDAPIPASGTITDTMIEAEGARLVDTGKVPAEDGKNILMFFFPKGVVIDQGGGTLSCQVFCAYHSTFTRNGNNFYYGIMPDQGSGGCEQGCGSHTTPIDNTYSTASHELVEAITDGAVGINQLAWYDDANGEIGDICTDWDGTANSYTVQSEWSNAAHGCTDRAPTTNSAIDVQFDDAVVTAPGGNATYALTSSGNATGQLTLSTAGLNTTAGNFTATFSPASINVGSSSTLTVGVPATARGQDTSFKVAATDTNGVHHFATVNLHIQGPAPTITSASVATGPSQGGTAVTLTGTNIGAGARAFICDTAACAAATKIPAKGSYMNGSAGKTFNLVTPSHKAAANGTTVKIALFNPHDTTPVTISFKYTAGAAPTVTTIDPNEGLIGGGTFVTITGTNFSSNSTVMFGATQLQCDAAIPATQNCSIVDDKTIQLNTPAVTTAGKVNVVITNADTKTVTVTNGFNYGPHEPPAVSSLSVATGPTTGGTYVTVFGANFDATPTVMFGGVAATVKTVNPGFLGVVTPAHAAGMVDVIVANGDAQTAKSGFTFADTSDGGTGGGTDDMGDSGPAPYPHVPNTLTGKSSGCSMSLGGDAAGALGLLVVFACLGFALRRQRA